MRHTLSYRFSIIPSISFTLYSYFVCISFIFSLKRNEAQMLCCHSCRRVWFTADGNSCRLSIRSLGNDTLRRVFRLVWIHTGVSHTSQKGTVWGVNSLSFPCPISGLRRRMPPAASQCPSSGAAEESTAPNALPYGSYTVKENPKEPGSDMANDEYLLNSSTHSKHFLY